MATLGLVVTQRVAYKVTTKRKHSDAVADNLLNQNFNPVAPNQVWAGDVTYRVPGIRHLHGQHKRITNLSGIYTFETGVTEV